MFASKANSYQKVILPAVGAPVPTVKVETTGTTSYSPDVEYEAISELDNALGVVNKAGLCQLEVWS